MRVLHPLVLRKLLSGHGVGRVGQHDVRVKTCHEHQRVPRRDLAPVVQTEVSGEEYVFPATTTRIVPSK